MKFLREPVLEQDVLTKLFIRFKEYFIYSGIIAGCVFIFFYFIFPQINELRLMKEEEKIIEGRIALLKNNISTLSQINDSTLDNELLVAATAFGQDKDFVGILNSIAVASANANVGIGDFVFQVGELSPKNLKNSSKLPSLNITLSLNSGAAGTKRFINELYKILPISDVSDVRIGANNSSLSLVYYYRPLPSVKLTYSSPIKPLSAQEITVLEKLNSWNTSGALNSIPSTQ